MAIANLEADFTYRKKQYADSLAHAAEIREKDLIATRAQLGESTANNRSIIIGSLALLIIGGGFSVYRNRQQRHRRETAEANLKTAEYQNKALRAQMEPHFIRNTIALAIARLRKKSDSSVDDASEPDSITPRVALARERTRLACMSCPNISSMWLRISSWLNMGM